MASGLLLDYMGTGPIVSRPASPTLHTGTLGLWYADDTGVLSAWDGSVWADVSPGGGGVVSVNGQTGTVSLALEDLDDVDAAAPTDGYALTWNNSAGKWEPAAPSGGMSNPMTTAGDIIIGGTSGAPQRLAAGTDTYVLTMVSGAPAWAAGGGGGGSDVLDVQTPTNASGTVTLDFDSKSRYVGAITLGANVTTLAFSNLPGAGKFAEYELHITQDPSTPRTFAIPASHKALGGSDTAIAAGVNVVTVLTASTIDNGTTWRYAMQESA